ncbi:DUF4253 domain-containing protein [Riemerella anatipestifer]|nr:DUF4253 domain-containing protein [Riemerella anatipestifer]MDY3324650.1 DUF4253 domain-containing protein [Riemerella anatipestifer]MDY3353460.1 DUF4253 domain-containing protein [Riemerella anatipestifer]
MRNIFLSFLCFLGLTSCNGQKLSADELKLIQEINLDQETALKIKKISTSEFQRTIGHSDREMLFENFESLKAYSKNLPKAIKITAKANDASDIVRNLKEQLLTKGLIIYKSEENYGRGDDTITILQSKNKFEPLLFEATNAVNYDIYTPQIIERLKLWDSYYGIKIYGVGFDFVSGEFKSKPKDLSKFAKEMYDFCPDIVDQGVGDIIELENTLKSTNDFFLWWD